MLKRFRYPVSDITAVPVALTGERSPRESYGAANVMVGTDSYPQPVVTLGVHTPVLQYSSVTPVTSIFLRTVRLVSFSGLGKSPVDSLNSIQ